MCFPMERVPWTSEVSNNWMKNKYATFRGVFILLDVEGGLI